MGNDWAVFKTLKNGQTGRHAGSVQGAYFKVGFFKPAVNRTIRITGYGVDRDTPTRSQTNQTHAGPLQTNSGTRLCYVTDTEGGNSGSPVIDETSGMAVGVHTHGGCRTTGTGCNSGTSTTLAAFQTAIRNLKCEPPFCNNTASFRTYGAGCKSAPQKCSLAFQQNWQQKLANKPWLGVEMDSTDDGHYRITRVVPDSPAEAAGFAEGDILLAMNGEAYTADNKKGLKAAWTQVEPGSDAVYIVKRNGEKTKLKASLGHVPDDLVAQWIGQHMLDSHLEAPVKVAKK